MSRRRSLVLFCMLFLFLAAPAFNAIGENSNAVPPVENTMIKIGFLNDMANNVDYSDALSFSANAAVDSLSMYDGYAFEIVIEDLDCLNVGEDETWAEEPEYSMAETAAQSLADAGVVAVVGAACSGTSMAANTVLAASGIPQISYASTHPDLSDDTAYPNFFRLLPSDTIQSDTSQADAMADMVAAGGVTSPALIHTNSVYGTNLADSFESIWNDEMSRSSCLTSAYQDDNEDFSGLVQTIIDAGCDSVVLLSESASAGSLDIIQTLRVMGSPIAIFGSNGIAGQSTLPDDYQVFALDGVQVTQPRAADENPVEFVTTCAADDTCAAGIYTAEAFDAVMMIGEAAVREDGANLATHLMMVGVDYAGASGIHNFMENGDAAGDVIDVCTSQYIPNSSNRYNCYMRWTPGERLVAAPFMGDTVKIGFLNPVTGPLSVYESGFEAASNIALYMANIIGWNNMVQFEIVYADSGCDGSVAATAAQTLVDAGVVGVIGAACSSASMGANAVLSAAGIPMISYSSSSPELTDSVAYPNFFRVVPSDDLQGQALNAVVAADMPETGTVALVYETDSEGTLHSDSFSEAYIADGDELCTTIGYDDSTSEFSATVEEVLYNGCTSVVMISTSYDGAAIVEEMAVQGFTGQIYGTERICSYEIYQYISDESNLDNISCVAPIHWSDNSDDADMHLLFFQYLCDVTSQCTNGIYTYETHNAASIMMESYLLSQFASISLTDAIGFIGYEWGGSGANITFNTNGDVGIKYLVCKFSTSSIQSFEEWHSSSCPTTYLDDSFNFIPDNELYGYDILNIVDGDGDGLPDIFDAFPNDGNETDDSDGDGVGDNADAFPNDTSETADTDGDGVGDNADAFPNDASETVDNDGDGVGDNGDNCPSTANHDQKDLDDDGLGTVCDSVEEIPDNNSSGNNTVNSNTAPAVTDVTISPLEALQSDELTCNYNVYDADGDTLVVNVTWLVNGVVINTDWQSDTLGSAFNWEDEVVCSVTASDGQLTSNADNYSITILPESSFVSNDDDELPALGAFGTMAAIIAGIFASRRKDE